MASGHLSFLLCIISIVGILCYAPATQRSFISADFPSVRGNPRPGKSMASLSGVVVMKRLHVIRLNQILRHSVSHILMTQSDDLHNQSINYSSILSQSMNALGNSNEAASLFDIKSISPFQKEFIGKRFLSNAKVIDFFRDGHILMKGLLKREYVSNGLANDIRRLFEDNKLESYRHKLRIISTNHSKDINMMSLSECEELVDRDLELYPFMQMFNIWQKSAIARSLALNPQLGRIAAELLGLILFMNCILYCSIRFMFIPMQPQWLDVTEKV